MPRYPWIEFPLLVLMVGATLLVLRGRSSAQSKGIGVRVIQLIALIVLLPLSGILALEGKISSDAIGGLIGVAIGYTLSGVEKPVPKRRVDSDTDSGKAAESTKRASA